MGLRRIAAAEALGRLGEFDAVIDARSEDEFADDHLPGAVNWPSLSNSERALVGYQYQQVSPFEARKQGAVLVARNVARHVEANLMQQARDWRPLVYCWRGGQRSGALATVLDQIGFSVHVVDGGYREFRRAVVAELETRPRQLNWRTVIGRTGSAKTRLLQALRAQGEPVLDLEALACHKGSVLGPWPGQPQPSQKRFDTLVWSALRAFSPGRPIYVEGESRTIGRLRVPERLLEALHAAPCVQVQMPLAARVAFLLGDYGHYVTDIDSFCERLDALRELRGNATVKHWQTQARLGQLESVVAALLIEHYDPIYQRSMRRNFSLFDQAQALDLPDGLGPTLADAAARLVRQQAAAPGPSVGPAHEAGLP